MVALWLQKIVKSKRIDGINVKLQQHIATKENQFRKILMPFLSSNDRIVSFRPHCTYRDKRLQAIRVVVCNLLFLVVIVPSACL